MPLQLAKKNEVNTQPESYRVGLIGAGIAASRTPRMHMAEAEAQGFQLHYELIDTDLLPQFETIADVVNWAEGEGFAGCNVTFPHKKTVIAELDMLSDAARRTQAVNTVVFRDGKRFGHNTDYWGFATAFKEGVPLPKKNALLLGAGGAGSSVAFALSDLGVETVAIFDANEAAAAALVAQIPNALLVKDIERAANSADVIVNATPMGMAKLPGSALSPALIKPDHHVVDIVYFPIETELLRAAKTRGAETRNGAGMAVYQAVRAFELFTGRKPDPKRMWATFDAFVQS